MAIPPVELETEITGRVVPFGTEIADDAETEDLRRQIQQTRAQMGDTIDEIQRRLSPDYLIERTQDAISETVLEDVIDVAPAAENKKNSWRTSAIQVTLSPWRLTQRMLSSVMLALVAAVLSGLSLYMNPWLAALIS